MMLTQSLAIGATEVVLAGGILVLLTLGAFRGDRATDGLNAAALVLLALAAVPLALHGDATRLAWGGLYVADAFSRYLKLLILAGSAAAILIAAPYWRRIRLTRFEYPILLLLSTLGMSIMVSAHNLLALYVGLEMMSLSGYVLAAFQRDDGRSSEAGLKYFALGALASGLLLYGVSLVYGFTGSTDFVAIARELTMGSDRNFGALVGLVFILSGLAFKVSAVPFHMWTPDVYQGAPTPVAAFFGTAPKVAAMGLLVRVTVEAFGGLQADWQPIIIFMSLASMALGAVGAIGQTNLKRLLAYSAIANIGFALIGLAAGTADGIAAVLFYLALYLVMKLGAFVCLLALVDADGQPREELSDLAGLVRTKPGIASALAIFMLSLAGLPPLLGFMPKLKVFSAAVEAELWPLAILGVLSSVIAAFFYLRVVKLMFFDSPADVRIVPGNQGANPAIMAVTAAIASPLGFAIYGPLALACVHAAASLF
jgi:NADH-quinone oxidoreductase subunit N